MMPPTSIDGTDITGATIDGTDVTEITVDGQTVFTAGLDIPDSVVALYDARQLTGYSDGQTVDPFTASVGNDFSSVSTPSYVSSGIAGNASISYDGTSDGHSGTNVTVQQPYTIYTVIDLQATSPSSNICIAGSESTTVVHQLNPNQGWEHFAGENFYGSTDFSISIFSAFVDGSNSVLREDGSITNTGNAGNNPLDLGSIGYWVQGDDRYFPGDVGYVELHDNEPSNGFATREQEIIDDWGLSV